MRNTKIEPEELVREGTILITRRSPASDFFMDKVLKFTHLGIVAIENGQKVVYDIHPDNKNNSNGNLDKSSFSDYMVGRNLIGIHHTGSSTARIQAVSQRCVEKKYDKYYFNCQRFIDEVTYNEFANSDIYSYYAGIIIPSAIISGALIWGLICIFNGSNKKT